MENRGLIIFGVLSLVLLLVDASSQELKTDANEGDAVYQAGKYKCPFPFGPFSDPEDCSHYYICVAGMAVHKKCRMFMHFDVWRRTCLPAMIAICRKNDNEDEATTEATTLPTTTESKENTFSCPSFWGSFPDPNDCSKYYYCRMYRASLKSCPENQLFDAIQKECKPENEVNCGDRKNPSILPTTAEPSETVTDVSTTAEPTETVSDVLTTAEPTETDIETVKDEDVTTEETTLNEVTEFPTGPPDHDCKEEDLDCIIDETGDVDHWFICPRDIGSFSHPSSDHLFIFCMNWIPSAKKCGQNLVFSKELSTCIEKREK